jgi:hypothetical protein
MTKTATQVFERSICFVYDTRVFSVTRDATIERRSATRRRKDVQDIIDKKHVRQFGNLKQEAFRSCRSLGTKLAIINAWITPEENEQAQWDALEDIQKRWDKFTNATLYPNYQDWVHQHARANPTESVDILALAPTLAEVKRSTRFVFTSFRLSPDQIKAVNLDQELGTLAEQALHEIASELKDCGLTNSKAFTQSTPKILGRISKKARTLAYLHPRLLEMHEVIERVLPQLPTSGQIKDMDALAIRGILDAIMDADKFMSRGFGLGDETQGQLDLPHPSQPEAEQPPREKIDVAVIAAEGDQVSEAAEKSLQSEPLDEEDADEAHPEHVTTDHLVADMKKKALPENWGW